MQAKPSDTPKNVPVTFDKILNLDEPRWDQNTFWGRVQHFIFLSNPINFFTSDDDLDKAKSIVDEYRKTKKPPHGYDEDKLWGAKYLVDGSFHPNTGEKMIRVGRMSAQVPMNTLITGCMLTFYKTKPAIMFWQWFNQTFNAIFNYTNRSGDAVITSNELKKGTPVFIPEGKSVGESKKAARTGILLVCISRIAMALPPMTLVPFITNYAIQRKLFCHYPLAVIPFQLSLVCFCLMFSTPLSCALFQQKVSMDINSLEAELKDEALKLSPKTTSVYYNKGL